MLQDRCRNRVEQAVFGEYGTKHVFTLVCVGGSAVIESCIAALTPKTRMIRLRLDDDELRAAYGGAHAFLYPSRYEGFGMPVLEAMACGAPVVTCRKSSITEIADDAALFVGEDDADGTAQAIERLCDPTVREDVITRGAAAQAPKFGFADMARQVADELISTHRRTSNGEVARPNRVWQDLRETLQTSQSPKIFGVVLRQELRKRTLAMLRKFGGEPSRSRPVGVSPRAATQSGAMDDNRRRVLTKKSRTLASGAPARWEVTTTLTF